MKTRTKPSLLTEALLETADDMRRVGVMDAAAHEKITLRLLSTKANAVAEPSRRRKSVGWREGFN